MTVAAHSIERPRLAPCPGDPRVDPVYGNQDRPSSSAHPSQLLVTHGGIHIGLIEYLSATASTLQHPHAPGLMRADLH